MRKSVLMSLIFFLALFSGCSMQRMAIRQMEPVLNNSVAAFFEEDDLELARQAMAANLKLVEGLLKSDAQNQTLLQILAQGYAGYALAFVEDTNANRARKLYLRARDYAWRLLEAQNKQLAKTLKTASAADWERILLKARKKNVPALFWLGFSWSSYINLSLEDPQAILDLARVEPVMKRVLELDSSYFYGATYLFFGSLYGQKPPLLGGNPQKARAFFEKNFKLTGGKFLLSYVYAARFYAAKTLNEQLFDSYLQKVLDSPIDIQPNVRLLNQVAKQKAKRLLKKKSEMF
ncbi:hypothetical protein Calab_1131 [Caldithrix abyssi DSM 13497]|uniref:TRAP transporter T-component n=1 Tax=Caldithrix abyssi DSM 13497 TaxID=880073 RepID=H1XWH7_CALAY|nr:TRAP transporter TatT component family protein [Caldithrix abyssi]APF20744.1 TRAP transporter T-component [Caldithrix abyssi DSM 13497]EHO40759.1 hypothetical protein Calab_1131 [Caldithrix abyssi DSM 13497]